MKDKEKFSPSESLRSGVLSRIRGAERTRARVRLFVSLVVIPASLAGAWFSVHSVLSDFAQSSFSNYFSLLFSDPDVVLANWREFALSLVESVPLFSVTLSFAALGALLFSLRAFALNLKNSFIASEAFTNS